MNCIFCKIISGELPADFVYKDDAAVAFRAKEPAAPVHILIVPRRHVPSLCTIERVAIRRPHNTYEEANEAADIGHTLVVAPAIAALIGLPNGYRVVANTGEDAGQTVQHVHLHLLGGRKLGGL